MTELAFTSFTSSTLIRPTAFGIYDDDSDFQKDADKIVYYIQRELGAPVVESELDIRQIWTNLEQATLEYSKAVNAHHARNVLIDFLGQNTGSLSGSENAFPVGNQSEFARKHNLQYSAEFGSGGGFEWYNASIDTVPDQQEYDLWPVVSGALTGANEGKNIVVRKIHHYEPFASFRFFDTTSVLNFLGNELNFESYSPETIFYLLPIWEDVLRGTQLELNQRVRRSNYSFDLRNFKLRLYPTPSKEQKVFFEYTINPRDPTEARGHKSFGVVSNISNVAFGHIGYSDINSHGKTWIWQMTLAFCKESLGHIWSKYSSIPVLPDGVNLGGQELIQRGREDQANLRQELSELLEKMSYKNLMEERQELADAHQKEARRVPLMIYLSN